MKYLMSFHNQQGLENILPIAQKLCENELNEVSLLDLRELYGQPKTSFQNLNNIFVKSENSIYKNIRKVERRICVVEFYLPSVYFKRTKHF